MTILPALDGSAYTQRALDCLAVHEERLGVQHRCTVRLIAQRASRGRFDRVNPGTHGHVALAGAVYGSVTGKTRALCPTPVLRIR